MNGQVLVNRVVEITQGENVIILGKEEVSTSGVLYYEVELDGTKMIKKMVLIK